MTLLLFYLISSFEWYPIPESDIYGNFNEFILNSREVSSLVKRYGGEEYLVKGFIHLDGDIFKGGEMVLLPKGYKITRTPENLQLLKRNIDIKKYNRFTALYKEGELKTGWNELASETEYDLGISSLENLSLNDLRELFPGKISVPEERREEEGMGVLEEISLSEEEIEREARYPRKHYFSFILIEDNWIERLIPVILHLSPLDETINELKRMEE